MCGLAALFEKDRVFDPALCSQIDLDIFHRGPDSGGMYSEPGCALIFRRLSIMDPTEGADQPMTDPSGRYVLIFNGEIYNFKELRKQLEDDGLQFKTAGDTEVILNGFIKWGPDIAAKLDGMFAFVLWDKQEKTVWAARDPLGIKPLYMARKGALTGFASENRPLRRLVGTQVNPDALAETMIIRYPTERLSCFKNIEMIPGGTLVKLHVPSGEITEKTFADILDTYKEDNRITYEDALQIVENEVVDSIKRHLQSDVGYCVQLSGGVDSSLVTAIAAEHTNKSLKTFGVKLEDPKHDESQYRKMVIDQYKTDHHEIMMTGKEFAEGLPDTCKHMEGPTAHMGTVFLKALCREIEKTDKVTLVGEGADEFFAGYDRYAKIAHTKKMELAAKLIPAAAMDAVPRLHNLKRYKTLDPALVVLNYSDHNDTLAMFPDFKKTVGTAQRIRGITPLEKRICAADQLAYLGSLLLRQDKISMAHSVEVRTPFTHMPLARAINKIPYNIRMPGGETKPLLKKVAEKWLPHDLLYRRKVGLTLPFIDWLKDDNILKPFVDDLRAPDARLAAYADREKLVKYVDGFQNGTIVKPTLQKIMITLVSTEIWLKTIENDL